MHGFLLATSCVHAHPMGNMGISHYSELRAGPDRMTLHHVLDFAEIPTFAEIQRHTLPATAGQSPPAPYLRSLTAEIMAGLKLSIDGRATSWSAVSPCRGIFSEGTAGMLTLRVTCDLSAPLSGGESIYRLQYHDTNYPRRSGWKEIVLRTDAGVIALASSVPATGRSEALNRYPQDAASAPPQVLTAHATLRRAAPSSGK